MPTMKELHDRLKAVSEKVEQARQQVDFKRGLSDGHNLTSGEILARYEFLQKTLKAEMADTQVHDHHVSALEEDALNWINSVDLGAS